MARYIAASAELLETVADRLQDLQRESGGLPLSAKITDLHRQFLDDQQHCVQSGLQALSTLINRLQLDKGYKDVVITTTPNPASCSPYRSPSPTPPPPTPRAVTPLVPLAPRGGVATPLHP